MSSAFQLPRSSALLQHHRGRTRETVFDHSSSYQVENVVLVFRQVKAQLNRTRRRRRFVAFKGCEQPKVFCKLNGTAPSCSGPSRAPSRRIRPGAGGASLAVNEVILLLRTGAVTRPASPCCQAPERCGPSV